MSVGEMFWTAVIASLVIWHIARYAWRASKRIDSDHEYLHHHFPYAKHAWQAKLDAIALDIGWGAYVLIIPLFFPVSRSSPLLRASGVSFEQAINYHRWMGHATMWLILLHSVGYLIVWGLEGVLWQQVVRWQRYDINNLAGEIGTLVALAMWFTSIGPVRRKRFEVFFYTHQLYILFVLFLAMHLGDWSLIYFPTFFLFCLDRAVRFVQSWHTVAAQSAALLPDGSVEITFPISEDLKYKALDSIFVCIPAISHLQWHPFSISSSPLDGRKSLTLIVKPLGSWTLKLHSMVTAGEQIEAKVEGPYGQEQDYFAKYDALVLVAGGSGIVPILSILKDLLHRCKENKQKLPSDVYFIYAVKTQKELGVLDSMDALGICPNYSKTLNLHVQLFVTQADPESNGSHQSTAKDGDASFPLLESKRFDWPVHEKRIVPQLFTGNDYLTAGMYVFVVGGMFAFGVLVLRFIVNQNQDARDESVPLWASGIIYVFVYVFGVIICVGIAAVVWYPLRHFFAKWITPGDSSHLQEQEDVEFEPVGKAKEDNFHGFHHEPKLHFGQRPHFQGILFDIAKRYDKCDIGVLASGPTGMVEDLSAECHKQSPFLSIKKRTVFNFHSISFSL